MGRARVDSDGVVKTRMAHTGTNDCYFHIDKCLDTRMLAISINNPRGNCIIENRVRVDFDSASEIKRMAHSGAN